MIFKNASIPIQAHTFPYLAIIYQTKLKALALTIQHGEKDSDQYCPSNYQNQNFILQFALGFQHISLDNITARKLLSQSNFPAFLYSNPNGVVSFIIKGCDEIHTSGATKCGLHKPNFLFQKAFEGLDPLLQKAILNTLNTEDSFA